MSAKTRNVIEVILVSIVCLVFLGGMFWILNGAVESRNGDPSDRVRRMEDRIDQIDQAAIQATDPDLTEQQKNLVFTRINHLQQAVCTQLENWNGKLPDHLRQAQGDICEAG